MAAFSDVTRLVMIWAAASYRRKFLFMSFISRLRSTVLPSTRSGPSATTTYAFTFVAAIPRGAGGPARVLAGVVAAVRLGALLKATVNTVTPREAVLTVNGQTLPVRPPPGVKLQPGAVFFVRVPPTAANATNPTLEL